LPSTKYHKHSQLFCLVFDLKHKSNSVNVYCTVKLTKAEYEWCLTVLSLPICRLQQSKRKGGQKEKAKN